MEQGLILILLFGVLFSKLSTAVQCGYVNKTEHINDQDHSLAGKNVFIPAVIRYHCMLIPQNDTLTENSKKSLVNGTTILYVRMKFRGDDGLPQTVRERNTSKMFKPSLWVRTAGKRATNLLLLAPIHDILAFKILEIETVKYNRINLMEYPGNCLDGLTYDNVEEILRELVLNNFTNTTDQVEKIDPDEKICNLHIQDKNGDDFRFYCCNRGKDMHLTCDYLHKEFWLELMSWMVFIVKAAIIFFCPLLIPSVFYQTITKDNCFRYELDKPKRISVQLKKGLESRKKKGAIYTTLRKIRNMERFRTLVDSLPVDNAEASEFDVKVAELQTSGERLVPEGKAPYSFSQTVYEFVFNHRVHELKSINACCDANVLATCPFNSSLTWERIARFIMEMVFRILFIAPFVIRFITYYKYETEEIDMRIKAARERGYTPQFVDYWKSFVVWFYLVFGCTILCLFVFATTCTFISKKVIGEFKILLRQCNQDKMMDRLTKVFGRFVQIILIPFKKMGLFVIFFGVFMWLFLIPFALVYFIFHMFPTVNLVVRMLIYIVVYSVPCLAKEPIIDSSRKKSRMPEMNCISESEGAAADMSVEQSGIPSTAVRQSTYEHSERKCCSKRLLLELRSILVIFLKNVVGDIFSSEKRMALKDGKIRQLLLTLCCLITTISVTMLLFEVVTFCLDVFVYTTINVLFYSKYTTIILSVIILFLVYAMDCFGSVPIPYRNYSTTINKYIMSLCEKQALPIIYQNNMEQENRAFALNPCINEDDPCRAAHRSWPDHNDINLTNTDNHLAWKVRKVAFFLTNDAKPKIPAQLLSNACVMNYGNKPGRLFHNYIKAFLSFLWIALFLLIVVLAIITFGELDNISATNQLLGTVGGGIIPFLLRKFVFKTEEDQPIEPEKDINFRVAIHDLINDYQQVWPVYDIEVERPTENITTIKNQAMNEKRTKAVATIHIEPRLNENKPGVAIMTKTKQTRMNEGRMTPETLFNIQPIINENEPKVETMKTTRQPQMDGSGMLAETIIHTEPRMNENDQEVETMATTEQQQMNETAMAAETMTLTEPRISENEPDVDTTTEQPEMNKDKKTAETMTLIEQQRITEIELKVEKTTTDKEPQMKRSRVRAETMVTIEPQINKNEPEIETTTTTTTQQRVNENAPRSDTNNEITEIVIQVLISEAKKSDFPTLHKSLKKTQKSDKEHGVVTDLL